MAGRVRAEDVATVRERARIDQVIGEVVTLRSAGAGSLQGLCPFHDERSPSFHVTPARGLYYCFGCGEGGDVVDFVMKMDHLGFVEALEKLAARVGVTLRYEDGSGPDRNAGPSRTRLAAANRLAAQWFGHALASPEAAPGRTFLSERGFDAGAVEHFGVGFAPKSWDGLLGHLRANGFSDAEAIAAGLVSQGQRGTYDRFRGRLIWPIRDASGEVLGFGARRLLADDDGPKYLNTPETPLYRKSQVLYGIDLARRDIAKLKQVVVVEGYTDVMAAHLAGVTTAVATCGTAFGPDHASLLRRYLVDSDTFGGEVIFTFDGDAAGQKAALRAFEGDQRFVAQTFVAVSPDGMDPCELRLARGDAAVRELVAARTPLFRFAIRSALAGFDLGTAEGRVAAMRRGAPVVAGIRDAALRPEYTRLLAGWVGLPEQEVRSAVQASGRGGRGGRGDSPGSAGQPGPTAARTPAPRAEPDQGAGRPHPKDPRLFVERESLKCALQVPELLGDWYASVTPECFQHPAYRAIHATVAAAGGPGARTGQVWTDAVLAACPDDRHRSLVRELAVEPLVTTGDPTPRYATSIVARLLSDEAGRRLAGLTRELGQLDQVRQSDQVAALLADVMDLEGYRRELGRVGLGDS